MTRKPLIPLILTVAVLFLAASGLSVFAARAVAENRAALQASDSELTTETGDVTQVSQNDDEDTDEIAEPEETEGQAIEESTAVTETTITDTTASATMPGAAGEDEDSDDQDEDINDDDDQDEDQPTESADPLISLDDAKAIALNYVGSEAVILETEFDRDDNPPKYEITLVAGDFEYEIEIHAVTGAIIEMERESADDSVDD